MADEEIIDQPQPGDEKANIIVPIGSQAHASKDQVKFTENYEEMTEDFIGTFNHACTQGMVPIEVMYAQASAFSIVLGCFIRAGLKQAEVGKLLMMVGRNAAVMSKAVQVIENQSVTDVLREHEPKVQ